MSSRSDIKAALAGRRIEAVVIGASAGGIEALLALLPALPASMKFAVVCILHLAADRESRLAELFGERVAVPVRDAADKEEIRPGVVYFAVPAYHLSIEQERSFSLSCEPPVHFARPSIDVLMESAADAYGSALAGILLTGANQDGAAGMARIKACGGLTIVQDPKEAQSATMPQQAIARSAPDLVLPLARIAALLPKLEEP
jgi:two-component system, chemotaxis family, protein-glutamate methylesterase/glutaminase